MNSKLSIFRVAMTVALVGMAPSHVLAKQYCFFDPQYPALVAHFDDMNGILYGYSDTLMGKAASTGVATRKKANYAVAYIDNTMRYFSIDISAGRGLTWGVDRDGSFFDEPHPSTVEPCGDNGSAQGSDGSKAMVSRSAR